VRFPCLTRLAEIPEQHLCQTKNTFETENYFVNLNVKKPEEIQLDFEINKLTNSIENAISGEVFDTFISKIAETRKIKKSDWVLIGIQKLNPIRNLFIV
jgi:hypothetical protein